MNTETTTPKVYIGYFAALLPALIIAVSAAALVTTTLMPRLGLEASPQLAARLTAAIFVGLCLANPVGVWLRDSSIKLMVLRLFVGMMAGVVLYQSALLPLAGEGVMRFALLFAGAAGVPILMAIDWMADRFGKPALDAGVEKTGA